MKERFGCDDGYGVIYAHEYNGDESRPLDSYSIEPLITEDEIEEENVNEYAVFDYCNVYYC